MANYKTRRLASGIKYPAKQIAANWDLGKIVCVKNFQIEFNMAMYFTRRCKLQFLPDQSGYLLVWQAQSNGLRLVVDCEKCILLRMPV